MEAQEAITEVVDESNKEMPLLNPMAFYPRFPHIAEQILEKMDLEGLKIYRLLSKYWLEYIDRRNLLRKKIIEKELDPNKAFRKWLLLSPYIDTQKMIEFLIKNSIKYNIDLNAKIDG